MERAGIRSSVWYLGVLAASLVGALVGSTSTILLFIIVGETLFYFLSLCFTALVAALCAVFVGDALAADGRGVRLWSVVGVSEVAGILAALANLAFVESVGNRVGLAQIGLGQQMTLSAIFVALVSGLGSSPSARNPGHRSAQRRDKCCALDPAGLDLADSGGGFLRHLQPRRLTLR